MDLKGKKILFVCPRFFGYENHIINELEVMGAEVSFLTDRPFDAPILSALTRLFPNLATRLTSKATLKVLKKFPDNTKFDVLFVINGQTLSKKFLTRFKSLNPESQSVLYIWDSLRNRKNLRGKFSYFDRIFTFDPADAKKYNLHFRPLFFANNLKRSDTPTHQAPDYQLVFLGTMHSDRLKVIQSFTKHVPSHVKTFLYLYIQAPWVYWLYKITKKEYRRTSRSDFRFNPINHDLLDDIYSRSSIILDIEHPNQQGLTMRTLESIGGKKKLITTNRSIQHYDFYNTNNIAIIDRDKTDLQIDPRFWDAPYKEPDKFIVNKYTLRGWLEEVLDHKDMISTKEPKVAILLCTYQGERYLNAQLDSFVAQKHMNWQLWVSDDNSIDGTHTILEQAVKAWGKDKISIHKGPSKGYCANFLSLTCKADIQADFFAYSDQDDIWQSEKLERALAILDTVPQDLPALYCSRTLLVDADDNLIGMSPLFSRAPGFKNALTQNIGGGNTMVFNKAARKLLIKAGEETQVVTHDWWIYLLVSGCGGQVFYDPQPTVRYRQHDTNLVGMNSTLAARLKRINLVFQGRFREWNDLNVSALLRVRSMLTIDNQAVLDQFIMSRKMPFIERLRGLIKSGIYRQTILDKLGLIIAAIFNKI